MKLVLAILCSVMLTATPFVAPALMPCAKVIKPCCTGGKPMPCCADKDNSAPQNAPAVPVPSGAPQHQVSFLISAAVIWTLPETPGGAISSTTVSQSVTVTVPLFAQNCARLL